MNPNRKSAERWSELNDASQLPLATVVLPWVDDIWNKKTFFIHFNIPHRHILSIFFVDLVSFGSPAGSSPSQRRSSDYCSPPVASPA